MNGRPEDGFAFQSILRRDGLLSGAAAETEYFRDLHLGEIIRSITAGREQYDLAPFYRDRVTDVDTIRYRHEVYRDLERPGVMAAIQSFARGMREVRAHLELAKKSTYRYERERWILAAASSWCRTVRTLLADLDAHQLDAEAMNALRDHLGAYVASAGFAELAADVERLEAAIGGIRYRLRLEAGKLTVSRTLDEPDFGIELLATFERFKQGDGREYGFEFTESAQLNHVEAAILERVALLFPSVFASLDAFVAAHGDFAEPVILRFDREVQFYVAYLEHVGRLRRAGLAFSLPEIVLSARDLAATGIFDLALANILVGERTKVVLNDIEVRAPERTVVITGPNQGGKTTFARAIGQLHHLAALGCPVPGTNVRVGLVDGIHTLFERQEAVEDLAGKLEDDLQRMRAILGQISDRSLVIMNETFSSTTVEDQAFINRAVLGAIDAAGAWCVTVTFLDELATLGPSTLSMVSTVNPENPRQRTFRILRRKADGLAYAHAVAEKHGLTYEQVRSGLDA